MDQNHLDQHQHQLDQNHLDQHQHQLDKHHLDQHQHSWTSTAGQAPPGPTPETEPAGPGSGPAPAGPGLLQEKSRLQQAVERLESALNEERSEHVKLEAVLAEKRRLEWNSESETQQIVVEKQQLNRRLSELQSELESEAAECRRLRSQAAMADAEVERLRRDLTNEQYEKERANQELRRLRSLQLLNF
ncbi:hypothetical protein FHG87_003531 [Trinorchestia longiramus]|nr:hypothetical protein FHG87_003531 [Trinorchestia longiramus]